jgi:hypothetical protein
MEIVTVSILPAITAQGEHVTLANHLCVFLFVRYIAIDLENKMAVRVNW